MASAIAKLKDWGVDVLQVKGGGNINVEVALKDKELIGLYFSAHWCLPCKGFTPILAEVYNNIKDKENLEIIFISSDRDQVAFDGYFGEMPWCAVPYEQRNEKTAISKEFSVTGIPTLVLLKPDGSHDKDGRKWAMAEHEKMQKKN